MALDLKHFRELIQQRIDDLNCTDAMASSGTDKVALDQSKVGRLSRMDALQSQAMNLAAQQRRDEEVVRLKAALRRIDEDDFGFCEHCGEDIVIQRLEIDPAALYCVPCANKLEKPTV